MTRRRHTLPAYVRRRWRALGLVVVLMLGALLVAAVVDRGHDPIWTARDAQPVAVALSPDAGQAYSLHGDADRIVALEARRGSTGALLWSSPMNDSRALLRAGDGWVAVATDFPRAFLTVYQEDGSVRFQVPIEGNARAMTGEGQAIALAVQAPGNPVLVYDGGSSPRIHKFPSLVHAVDLAGGRLAVGTNSGDVRVLDADGALVLNASLPLSVRSVRLSEDGSRLLVGGFAPAGGTQSGLVAFFELDDTQPLRWTHPMRAGVGLVALDATGLSGIVLEDTPPRNTVHAFETGTGRLLWSRSADGEIAEDDSGSQGGIAFAPDGRVAVIGTIRGDIQALGMSDGKIVWSYKVDGTTAIAFAGPKAAKHFVANARLSPTGPYESLLHFSTMEEPTGGRLAVVSSVILLAAATSAALVIGVGYARMRRA